MSANPTTTTNNEAASTAPIHSQPPVQTPVAQNEPPAQADAGAVEVDHERADEIDSTFDDESENGDYTTTIASSVFNYTYENKRRYHAYMNGAYIMPNDEREQDRLDLKHHVFKLTLDGSLFRAPIASNPQRILDVGTGTGIWAIDVADEFPSAEVIGTDLSPIQPTWVAPNCSFVVDNAEAVWPYVPAESFDLVHWRVLAGSIQDWPALYGEAYKHVKPGGWVEAQEHEVQVASDDGSDALATDVTDWFKKVVEASEKRGKTVDAARDQKRWMVEAGFVDVREDVYKVPLGRWPKDKKLKELGTYFLAQSLDAIEPVSIALFTRVLGFTYEEAHLAMVGPRKGMKNPAHHLYIRFHFVYGRKPETKS